LATPTTRPSFPVRVAIQWRQEEGANVPAGYFERL
jgi:hypothetical protein